MRILHKGEETTMKRYNKLEIVILELEEMDVLTTSGLEGDNNLPWVDVNVANGPEVFPD